MYEEMNRVAEQQDWDEGAGHEDDPGSDEDRIIDSLERKMVH
jgi:hypothetical protein